MKLYTKEELLEIIRPVQDPDIGYSVVEMGLIYEARHNEDRSVYVKMTLTSPGCPMGPMMGDQVIKVLEDEPGITEVTLDWTFSPPWDARTMASEDVKWAFGIFE